MARDYRALATAPIPSWGWSMKDFKSECLIPVSDIFTYHMVRTSTFTLMPAYVALEAIRHQLWIDYVSVREGRELNPDLMTYATGFDPSDEMVAEYNQLAMEYRRMAVADSRRLLREIGIRYIESRMDRRGTVEIGIEVVFESVIRESWTTLEDVARELWIVMLNNDDGTIEGRVQLANVLRNISKKVKPTFNPKRYRGSFQVETRQAVFQRLEEIKRLYVAAFGSSVKSLFDNVESGYVRVLYAFRNVLAHKRGKADREFLDQIDPYPEFSSIKENDIISPNGKEVRKMRDAAMILGRELILLSDAELQRQKKS